jgi:hypothetical protein
MRGNLFSLLIALILLLAGYSVLARESRINGCISGTGDPEIYLYRFYGDL